MADIIYKGVPMKGVRAVAFPKAGGGEAKFYEEILRGKTEWDYMGDGAVKIGDVYTFSATLAGTDYATWTPSTTAAVIVPSQNLTARAIDLLNHEYLIRWRFTADIAYNAGTTMKAVPVRHAAEMWQAIFKRPSNLGNLTADSFNGNVCVTQLTAPVVEYYNSSGTHTMAYTASYGFYMAAVAATFSSSTSNTPNLTIKVPTISARCNSTYFAVARGADVKQADSVLKMRGELWQINKGGTVRKMYENAVDLFNNPI
jgi:hypothetical protein